MNATLNPAPSVQTFSERFQSAEIIGFGGMATVYRVFDAVAQRDVALKVLHAHLREHPIIAEHFRQEYAIAQALEHPHIVRIHSIIDTPEMLALVMELHGTHDLKAHLQHHGKMEPRQVVDIATQILSALEAAHAQNIVHQDIKPHNILWDITTDTAKLIDFGLAELDETIALARPESAMATVEYSAPEQFDDFGSDARADLYSLGITLFELLSETLPYRGDSAASVIQMHREAPIPDVRVFARAVPEYLARALMRAMAKAPEDRFKNTADMRDALGGKSQAATHPLPAPSTEWEELKTYQQTRLANLQSRQSSLENDWNLYLPTLARTSFDRFGPKEQKEYAQVFFRLFQQYATHYHGDINLGASKLPDEITNPSLLTRPDTFYATLFSKDQIPLHASYTQNIWRPVPLASGLNFEQVRRIRSDLAKQGIIARAFHLDIEQAKHPETAAWQRLDRWRNLPASLNTFTLLLLIATSSVTLYIAAAHNIPALTLLTLLAWLLLFARACFSFALHKFAPAADSIPPVLFDAAAYQLQFNAPFTPAPPSSFLQDTHASIYLALRSQRIQNSFERILLTLLELSHAHPEDQEQTRTILAQTTAVATRITQLEKKLADQNYPALFEQLTRIDTQISRSEDADTTAQLIEQKSGLRTQLEQLDTDRHELKTLGRELLSIAEHLQT